jgi:hypothetical protein
MKKLSVFFLILMLSACGSSTQVPAWKDKAFRYLEDYKVHFLAGKEDATEPHFIKARKEIASGNDLSLLAVAYLTKYALHTASLESFDSAEFARLQRLEPNAANMAYCHFLKGNFSAVDPQALSSRYAGILKAASAKDVKSAVREINLIEDPLSRLIACGVWVRYLPFDEAILQTAISTASAHGWRRPLWAYLEKLHAYHLEHGDPGKAEAVKMRLNLIRN